MSIIGIDIGGSTTKIIGLRDTKTLAPCLVKANDPVASLFGAFGKFIDANNIALSEIDRVMITGVGASFLTKPIYGIKTVKVEEFLANGLGGLFLSGLGEALIVSMGTGTALVEAGKNIRHIGGTGIGGGTIMGLANKMLNIRDIDLIIQMAQSGNLSHVDLMVGDITKDALPGLPPHTTASNFGRISDVATSGDIALGIINLVMQSVGMSAVFAARGLNMNDTVLIGNLTAIPQCAVIFDNLKELFSMNFIIPPQAEYATALGAALAHD
ncbi:MAG: type II pantothenate kinase [Clostridiales bacterium]|jgi:type II pantothenate kinase|nr:type II pantothenate kinase [Clostridiales bacterium]